APSSLPQQDSPPFPRPWSWGDQCPGGQGTPVPTTDRDSSKADCPQRPKVTGKASFLLRSGRWAATATNAVRSQPGNPQRQLRQAPDRRWDSGWKGSLDGAVCRRLVDSLGTPSHGRLQLPHQKDGAGARFQKIGLWILQKRFFARSKQIVGRFAK